jgi:integrase
MTTAPSASAARYPRYPDADQQLAKSKAKRQESQPYLHGKGYAIRRSYQGHDIFLSGYKTEAAAKKALRARLKDIDDGVQAVGAGAHATCLAQAMQDYAMARLPFLKGAEQEARRINAYLRAAGLRLLQLEKLSGTPSAAGKTGKGAYFAVELVAHTDERVIPNGLAAHRRALLTANAKSDKLRAVLASMPMAEVSRDLVQRFVDQLLTDGSSPATVGLERAVLRVVFNYAFTTWRWTDLSDNPATKLKMPKVDNARSRVLSYDEQALLDAALADCRNQLVEPTVTLLRETAMRASEPLDHATWGDVDWTRSVLSLSDAKGGRRDVPLSLAAVQALHKLRVLSPGEEKERIVSITYDALAAAWRRAVERAGLKDLHVHDLRHTAATRMALDTGNAFLVKALTGHKTLKMLERYVNVTADDVVAVMQASAEKKASARASTAHQEAAPHADAVVPVVLQTAQEPAGEEPPQAEGNVVYLPLRRRA